MIQFKYRSGNMPKVRCHKCGSTHISKYVYGMPNLEMIELEKKGTIKFGGCCITNNQPTHYCNECKNDLVIKKQSMFVI